MKTKKEFDIIKELLYIIIRKGKGVIGMGELRIRNITVVKAICGMCGHEWLPKVENPAVCPRCKSYNWQIPKGAKCKR